MRHPTGTNPPVVSVLLPVRNEAAFIGECLRSTLAGLDHAGVSAEVLVIDGASSDATAETVRAIAATDARIRLLDNPRRTAPTGLNLGIAEARGTILVRLDGHARFPVDYFARCLAALEESGALNVGGFVDTSPRVQTPVARAIAAATSLPIGVGSGFRTGTPSGWADTVPFGCFRREAFDRVGLFDERLVRGQDYEFNRRLVKHGGRIWRDAGIRVQYYQLDRLLPFLTKQLLQQGPGVAAMWCLAPWSITTRHLAPLLMVLGGSALSVLAIGHAWAALVLLLAAVAYEGALIVSASRAAPSVGVATALLIPLTVTLYHLSYGAGILLGLLAMPFRLLNWSAWRRPWAGASAFRASGTGQR